MFTDERGSTYAGITVTDIEIRSYMMLLSEFEY